MINALLPLTARVGDIISITGSSFQPPGVTASPSVLIGKTAPMVKAEPAGGGNRRPQRYQHPGRSPGRDRIRVTSVVGRDLRYRLLEVTTAAGVASSAQQITVVADVPTIFSI